MPFLVTIGLEVHAQLKTKTKIFCSCELRFGAPPNASTCPVCLGLPGSLPVLNKRAFELALKAVLALGGTVSPFIKFDRKNYFYPDLPKGYQISQFDAPIGQGGFIEIETGGKSKKVRLNRVHMEEDAGKLVHDQGQGSLVDLNRAGTPLIEIVTEPDIESADEAFDYLTNLKAILKCIPVSDCDMEKGQLRCDANVSIRKNVSDPLGRRVEIKNLNSFRAVRLAILHEVARQSAAVEKGETIVQETRLWDDAKQRTAPMRSKEEAHDYRYFPEPDLVPFTIPADKIEAERKALPKLPREKKEDYVKQGLSAYDAAVLSSDMAVASFFDQATAKGVKAKTAVNWLTGPVFAYLSDKGQDLSETKLTPEHLVQFAALVDSGKVSFQAAKEKMLADVMETGDAPESVMKKKGLEQVSDDGALLGWIAEAIQANPKVVEDFKSGKESSAMFLVGQVMKKSGGKANPGKVQELVRAKLKEV